MLWGFGGGYVGRVFKEEYFVQGCGEEVLGKFGAKVAKAASDGDCFGGA